MVKDAAQLFTEIQQLSAAERAQLLSNLKFQDSAPKSYDLSREDRCVYAALLQLSGVRMAASKFLEQYGTRKFTSKVADVYAFISSTRKFLRQQQTEALVVLCLQCLAEDLQRRDIPVTPKVLLDNLASLQYAVDRCFPGYVRAGLLHKIVCVAQAA
jgi:hypothetical protein